MDRRQFLRLGAFAAVAPLVARIPAPAFAQGATLPKPLPNVSSSLFEPLQSQQRIEIGYRNAIQGYEHVYPTLAEAVGNWDGKRAMSTKIEWLRENRKGKRFVEHNFQQIIRTPYGITGTERAVSHHGHEAMLTVLRKENLHQHLAAVELTLKSGVRSHDLNGPCPRSTCGGASQYKPGPLRLRPLRDLVLLTSRQAMDYDGYTEEFLGEISLQVG